MAVHKATWEGAVLAESDKCVNVEGNWYFPKASIRCEYFFDTDHTTICGWKGEAHYYTIKVSGKENVNAAWYYPEPKHAAAEIKSFIAFWKGVTVV